MKIACRKCSKEIEYTKGDSKGKCCKECYNANMRKYHKNRKHEWVVYYLPDSNYCGITRHVKTRMRAHERDGRSTKGWRVLYATECKDTAFHMEAMYHSVLGMRGLSMADGRR